MCSSIARAGAQDERIGADSLGIVPAPRSVVAYAATYQLPASMTIVASTRAERNVAVFAADFLRARGITTGVVRTSDGTDAAAALQLTSGARDTSLGAGGYRLHVGSDGIRIGANAGAGLFYGLQTLEQMIESGSTPAHRPATGDSVRAGRENAVHYADIRDAPSYPYRGIHLDVARHFFPVSFVERYIDLAARYKLNEFHWHLVDDQGWRIEIRRYPRLTTVSSCRNGTMVGHDFHSNDRVRYCGYYTQDQIRQVVTYAKRRYVNVVPEIEMPGHSVEVLAAYPQLACAPGNYAVRTTWGVSDEIVCPSERTIRFYEDVLTEVMQLFPGPYVHTGGDEAPKTVWKTSPLVQALIRKHHLRNEDGVQGWFDRRIEAFLEAHGRRMIGWNEILAGDVSRSAIVESWQGTSGGVIAATRGNDVIMAPDPTLYFDHSQGDVAYEPLNIGGLTTLRDVYDHDPAIDALPPNEAKHVLGAEGCLWTEYIPTPQLAEYELLPRLFALAEIVWSPAANKDWDSFVRRSSNQYARLEAENVQFRIPEPVGLDDKVTDKPTVVMSLQSPARGAEMYYTLDGSLPTRTSTRYSRPFSVALAPGRAVNLRVVTILQSGRASAPASATIRRRLKRAIVP